MIEEKVIVDYLKNWKKLLDTNFQDEVVGVVLDVVLKKVQALPKIENDGWVLCSEKLPKPEEEVLLLFENTMTCGFYFVEGGHYDGTTNWFSNVNSHKFIGCDEQPIAWQPLPEKYQKG